MENTNTKKRNPNIEFLRIISMVMIIFLHALGKGNLLVNLSDSPSVNGVIAWVLEALSISAVNIFILISGYFLIDGKFKLKRLIELVCEVLFYSVLSLVICLAAGIDMGMEINIYFILQTIFPVHMDVFWFITSYLVIYILQPVISAGVKSLSQKHFGLMLIILLIYECIFKTVLPVSLSEDEAGYNVLWFLIVFLIGAYFKLYGFKHIRKTGTGWILYFGATFLALIENIVIDFIIAKTGHLKEIDDISMNYNHLFVLLAAVGIFAAFIHMKDMKEGIGKVICLISPMSLGVYLLHESLPFRYNWQKWLGIYDSLGWNTVSFVGRIFLAVLVVFVSGIVIDFLRIRLFKVVGKVFGREKE